VTLLEATVQRKRAKAQAAALLDKAMTESRSLTVAEQIQFDALISRVEAFDSAIAQRESLRKLAL